MEHYLAVKKRNEASLSMGTLQARILEWFAIPSSRGSFQPRHQPRSPALQVDSLLSEPPGKPWEIACEEELDENPFLWIGSINTLSLKSRNTLPVRDCLLGFF
ncbi:unnamed protein product [Rangifer tarandus platyrhynchus]|uniref:Uncharacterized protein n=1 Tax=Rangifer tarandus platyrhynchus TaxID=3082113 RepID=A0ABN9A3V8_RANTA|nr:unnamed protein product [Rangifer tarandus platyrhynchus]